ncbi:STAS domain-containing protein [Streptomyces sp. CT34]|uniref:STAS domain-containing protein n=1 Tax=Streptomyces sp. CT34 TaxID=1553907 RepID=UPI001F52930F|nr:STAS domain-containing protein [Streptomyces sp. CT34]
MMQVDLQATGPGNCRVTLVGDLDVCTAPAVRDTLRDAVSSHQRVDVDCGQLCFCDCYGLGVLLAAARAADAAGAELRLCAVPHTLARVLRLSRTRSAFTIEQPSTRSPLSDSNRRPSLYRRG